MLNDLDKAKTVRIEDPINKDNENIAITSSKFIPQKPNHPIRINRKIKIILVCLIFAIFLMYRIYIETLDNPPHHNKNSHLANKNTFLDKWQAVYTAPINTFLAKNLIVKDLLVTFASSLMDILCFSFMIYYIKFSNSTRTLLALVLFYFIRGNIQNIFLFTFPEVFLFDTFGGFSFTVPLGTTPDFFYSGHLGSAMIVTLTYRDKGVTPFYYLGIFIIFVQIFTLSVTRAHYSIDLIFGFIIGHFIYIMAGIFMEEVYPKIKLSIRRLKKNYKKDADLWYLEDIWL